MSQLRLRLIGHFSATTAAGAPLGFGLKARGLLALLAVSPGRRRTRALLQDRLWSEFEPSRAGANLRRALADIRDVLRAVNLEHCLVSDRHSVSLHADDVWVDLDSTDALASQATPEERPPELLEDLDGLADPEFEGWLRDLRASFAREQAHNDRLDVGHLATSEIPGSEIPASPPAVAEAMEQASQIWVSVRARSSGDGNHGTAEFLLLALEDTIARGIADASGTVIASGLRAGPGLIIELYVLRAEDSHHVHVRMHRSPEGTLAAAFSQRLPREPPTAYVSTAFRGLVNQCMDVGLNELHRRSIELRSPSASGLALEAMARIALLDGSELAVADALLDKAIDMDARPTFLAMKAFLRTFYYGERHPHDPVVVAAEARELLLTALRAEPHNATVLALGSHIRSFMLDEHASGLELARLSMRYRPESALTMSFLARAEIFAGETSSAYRRMTVANAVLGPSPFRFLVEFNASLAATVTHREDEAIRLAEIARNNEPRFLPPLRYLFALYLSRGERDKAHDVYTALRSREPDFSIGLMNDPSYPVSGLRSAQLLPVPDSDFD